MKQLSGGSEPFTPVPEFGIHGALWNTGDFVRLPVRTGMVEGGMTALISGVSQDTDVVASIQTAPIQHLRPSSDTP